MSGSAGGKGSAISEGVETRVLDNGLTVLVKEDHTTAVVGVVTYVKTGYFHEPDDLGGISHVIEHMYFNGTPGRPDPEDISRETKSYGGILNAGTIYDRTTYYVVLPSERWREGLDVQADAFQNPLFDPDVLEKEREAILQEARRKLDDPTAYGREKMFELAFERHRMRRWRIGSEEVLRGLSRDDLVGFYEDHYRPANTVLAVVGDVEADEVFAEVERLYGPQPTGEMRKHSGPPEPAQEALRYRRMHGDLQRNYLFLGYHTPGEGHPDNAALDVLATLLGSGTSSRLVGRLKEELGVVTSVSAASYQYDDVGVFEIDLICGLEDLDRAPRELFAEIERMKLYGPTAEELDRARSVLETTEGLAQEEVLGQASTLAHYQARGDYRLLDRELEQLRAVGTEDVQRVAQTYLSLENASLLEYTMPQAPPAREAQAMAGHLRGAILAGVSQMRPPTAPEQASSFLPREELAQWSEGFDRGGAGDGRIHRYELPRGGILLVRSTPGAPTFAAGAYFRGGRLQEIPNNSGLTRLMQRLMVKQTNNRQVQQLAHEIEGLGTRIGRVCTDDYVGFTVSGLRRNLPAIFDILFDVLANPRFTAEQLNREREVLLSAIAGVEDQSASLTFRALRAVLHPAHPYGLPELGDPVAVRYLEAGRLEEHYWELIRPENTVMVVAGDVEPELVERFVRNYAEQWSMGGTPLPSTAAEFYTEERFGKIPSLITTREDQLSKQRSQTAMAVAFPTVSRAHPDTPALEVLQAVTGGLGGLFFEEIRTRRGLAYQVSTFDVSRALAGFFGTYVACSPDSAQRVRELVIQLHERLADEPPDETVVDRARNYLAGSYVVGLQTRRAQVNELALLELLGLDLEQFNDYPKRIRSVTREDLQRVAKEYLRDRPHAFSAVVGTEESSANPR